MTGDGFLDRYAEKIGTPQQALSLIKPGNRVFIGTGCAVPATLLYTLEQEERDLKDVKLYHFFPKGQFFIKTECPRADSNINAFM